MFLHAGEHCMFLFFVHQGKCFRNNKQHLSTVKFYNMLDLTWVHVNPFQMSTSHSECDRNCSCNMFHSIQHSQRDVIIRFKCHSRHVSCFCGERLAAVYLVGRQKAEHTLGHDLADVEQQRAHLVLKDVRFSVLEGSQQLPALGSFTNSAHPHLRRGWGALEVFRSPIYFIWNFPLTCCQQKWRMSTDVFIMSFFKNILMCNAKIAMTLSQTFMLHHYCNLMVRVWHLLDKSGT